MGGYDPTSDAPAEQNIQITLPPYKQRHKHSSATLAGILDVLLSWRVVCESANTLSGN
jgi:hypothetical protein